MDSTVPSDLKARFEDALTGGDVDAMLAAASAVQAAGRSRVAAAWLEEAHAAHPESVRLAGRLLEIHLRYHNWAAFDAVAEAALERHPGDAELHYTRGCGWESRGAWAQAAASFGRAAELAPGEIEAIQRQARALRVDRRTREALGVIEDALRRHGDEAGLHAVAGYIWIELEDPLRAASCFKRALARQPDWQPYLDDLAGALMLAERWAEAAAAAVKSLRQRKRNERAWTVYGIAHHRLGDHERADQGYRNAVRAAKDPSRAQGNYGMFLATDPTRMLEAVRMLRAAHDAHPDWDEVADALYRLTAGGSTS